MWYMDEFTRSIGVQVGDLIVQVSKLRTLAAQQEEQIKALDVRCAALSRDARGKSGKPKRRKAAKQPKRCRRCGWAFDV